MLPVHHPSSRNRAAFCRLAGDRTLTVRPLRRRDSQLERPPDSELEPRVDGLVLDVGAGLARPRDPRRRGLELSEAEACEGADRELCAQSVIATHLQSGLEASHAELGLLSGD